MGVTVQFSLKFCLTLCDPMDCTSQASLSFTISQTLLKLMSIELVVPSNHLILCRPLLLLPSIFPSFSLFQWVISSQQVVKVLEFQQLSFQWIFRLISFRNNWFGLLVVQGTLKSLLQHHNSKCSDFFTVQLSHLYMTTGKTVALTIWTFVSKVIFLLFNMLSKFVIAFLPRGKGLLT